MRNEHRTDFLQETYTSTIWDGTNTESHPRPTITIVLDPPKFMTTPTATSSSYLNYARGAQVESGVAPTSTSLPEPGQNQADVGTVICNTIFYTSQTETLTSVGSIVNSGSPMRTVTLLMTHTYIIDKFATPPGKIETTHRKRNFLTYTTTFEVVTAGVSDVPVIK